MAQTQDKPAATGEQEWLAEYAFAAAVMAFVYGFPYIHNAKLRHDWVTQPRNPELVPYAAVNHFWHASRLMDATYRDGGCPNNDILYSSAWLDLRDEPVILSHPDMGDRYFTFELMGFDSDNFGYIGQRVTGSRAGDFAIRGRHWHGDLPPEVQVVARSPTPWVWVLGRTLVDGAADVANVQALQAQYRLTPLSLWGQPGAVVPERRDVYAPAEMSADPLGPWKTLNAMLAENPPPPRHTRLLRQFARLGIGPGLAVETQPDAVKQALSRAATTGMTMLTQQFLDGPWATNVNGWRYPPPEEDRFGDNFLHRAADQSLAGIITSDPGEAIYLVNFDDADGTSLSPGGRYELRLAARALPPVDASWSLTAYTQDMNLIVNDARRYSVSDRAAGLKYDADGGLTIYLQPASPGTGREPNWLPTSPDQPWFVILRMYRPHPEVVQATWECPGLTPIA